MPNYDYVCKNCGWKTIITHGINEKNDKVCVHCGFDLQKLISPGFPLRKLIKN